MLDSASDLCWGDYAKLTATLLLILSASALQAQFDTSVVLGTVRDPSASARFPALW